jgi:hypothetical protein
MMCEIDFRKDLYTINFIRSYGIIMISGGTTQASVRDWKRKSKNLAPSTMKINFLAHPRESSQYHQS